MSRICFVSYEIHPTTWGGAGVLLHHAAEQLLRDGHAIIFLLDIPKKFFDQFDRVDRLRFPNADHCRAYHVDTLVPSLPVSKSEVDNIFLWKAYRFDYALDAVLQCEAIDFVEFFEYCGVAHNALTAKLFGRRHERTILGMRAHNSIELIDAHESTKPLDRDRYILYAMERASLARAEAVLLPSESYTEAYYRERYDLKDEQVVISEPPTQSFGKRASLPLEECDEVIYFGRVFEFKGVELFIQAALIFLQENPDTNLSFTLIGPDSHDSPEGGSYIAYLRNLIPAPYRSYFFFPGHLAHEEARRRLGKALFGVFPNRFESFCYSLHEVYEAGVPVIVSDIPAFRNYFQHESNALVFDGSARELVDAMVRMSTDDSLREQLTHPYPVATEPLGSFYSDPKSKVPLQCEPQHPLRVLLLILVPDGAPAEAVQATLDAIAKCTEASDRVLILRRAREEANKEPAFTWLGHPRTAMTVDGQPVLASTEKTLDAIWILNAGDVPNPEYLPLCRRALASEISLAFAGCWSSSSSNAPRPSTLDIAAEYYPFQHGGRLTRALLRTPPGQSLPELFDLRVGSYGEIAYLWRVEDQLGRGAILSEVHLRESRWQEESQQPAHLAFLVATNTNPRRQARLASLAVVFCDDHNESPVDISSSKAQVSEGLNLEDCEELAWKTLPGRSLLRMALRKLAKKVGIAKKGTHASKG